MKYRFDYSEVLRLKAACAERFPDHVHFHDGCGGQYFNLDSKNDGLRRFICEYFDGQGMRADFFEDEITFTVSGKN